ncbi:hypothetical protein BST83_08950 [Polaribacter filamentus]|uniref:Uncharacterized protein n=1 Tax=Polaribacter filamentus TaxID=53483 RepID=A0A2S7KX86_9FLAO|nr:hypothetical protein BST83_08950 [Polaribacter filamentus]
MAKLKLVASLQTTEFPLEIPRSQSRNIQYTTTLATSSKKPTHSQAHFIFFVPQKIKRACLYPPLTHTE